MPKMRRIKFAAGFLLLAALVIWASVLAFPTKNLKIITCNVGQGDAILTVYGNLQILTDGGPGNRVLACLSRHMPFWDRKIELVILTHPEIDHYEGLIEVFKRYHVDKFLTTKLESSTLAYRVLKNVVGSSSASILTPKEGMNIRSGLIQIEILHPAEVFLSKGINKPNEISCVYELKFKEFKALFTGDIPPKVINELLKNGLIGEVDYIKIPHHGSKNGATPELIRTTKPKVASISVGERNSYGHPDQEVLEILKEEGVKTLRTDEMGDIELETDGQKFWINH